MARIDLTEGGGWCRWWADLQVDPEVRGVGHGPLTVTVGQLEQPRVRRFVVLEVHHH